MASKEWLPVESLSLKVKLATQFAIASSAADVARKLYVSLKTLQEWNRGSPGHEPGDVPQAAFHILTGLFAEALPHLPQEQVRRLVAGPPADLEHSLMRAEPVPGLLSFLDSAIAGEARLICLDETGLVEVNRQEAASTIPTVPLGAPFRIEFRSLHRLRPTIALQRAGLRWAAIPAVHGKDGKVCVPGIGEDGAPLTMSEHEQGGEHIFYCLQSVRPLPAMLKAALEEPVELDRPVLGMVARFHDRLAAADRRCQILRCRVGDEEAVAKTTTPPA